MSRADSEQRGYLSEGISEGNLSFWLEPLLGDLEFFGQLPDGNELARHLGDGQNNIDQLGGYSIPRHVVVFRV